MKKLKQFRKFELSPLPSLVVAVLLAGCITLLALWCQPNAFRSVLIIFKAQPLLILLNAMPVGLLLLFFTCLLRSVFFPKTALHDGAVILREGRLAAAGCVLPLTENAHISSDLGTRHRAGIGMSELSDAVVVIISEETGTVSVAVEGMLKRHLAPQMLEKLLKNELLDDRQDTEETLLNKFRQYLKIGGGPNAEK